MTTVVEFVAQASSSYLQSVVFVDDKIYQTSTGCPLENSMAVDVTSGLRTPFEADSSEEGQSSTQNKGEAGTRVLSPSDTDQEMPYHPRNLMESFAKKGIICALYEPRKGFATDPESELFRLCERADVVILDWDLYNDSGDNVVRLLSELIKQSASLNPHHVRLCVIYTGNPSLFRVTNQVYEALTKAHCEVEVSNDDLRLDAGATRIVVFGKPDSPGRIQGEKPREVKEADLADRVIEQFAGLHRGVLQAFALHGLASVRRNTKRFLDKFRPEMDGPFFLHRALGLETEDAFHQLPDLLADEMRAVLDDCWPGNINLQALANNAIGIMPIAEPPHAWTKKPGPGHYDAKEALRQLLLQGCSGLADARQNAHQGKDIPKGFRNTAKTRLEDFNHMLRVRDKCWSDELAMLYCHRTQYGQEVRILRYGTIVRHKIAEGDDWEYSVCLMPICDAVRLRADRRNAFPFWILMPDAKSCISGTRRGITINDSDGNPVSLAAGGKIREMLWMAEFCIDPARKAVASTKRQQAHVFPCHSHRIEWVGELKPLHVQRIAADLGQAISRVGLVESEWLRLFCDR